MSDFSGKGGFSVRFGGWDRGNG